MTQSRMPREFDKVLISDRNGRTFSSSITGPPNPADPELRVHVLAVEGAAVDYSRGFRFSQAGGPNTWRWPA